MSGDQYYPPADRRTQRFDDDFPGDRQEVNVVVVHTTEGTTWPTYSGGAVAPTLTMLPVMSKQQGKWRQHFPFDMSARALRNAAGGVDTNTLNVAQIELVGTCDPAHRRKWGTRKAGVDYIYWPAAPAWTLQIVADFARWCFLEHQVPLTCPPAGQWVPYPDSANPATWARFGAGKWRGFTGWCGHQHVPENVHGDPGDMDVPRVLALARQQAEPVTVKVRDGETLPQLADRLKATELGVIKANRRRFRWDLQDGEMLRRP